MNPKEIYMERDIKRRVTIEAMYIFISLFLYCFTWQVSCLGEFQNLACSILDSAILLLLRCFSYPFSVCLWIVKSFCNSKVVFVCLIIRGLVSFKGVEALSKLTVSTPFCSSFLSYILINFKDYWFFANWC